MALKKWIGLGLALGVALVVILTHRGVERLESDSACTSCHPAAGDGEHAGTALATHPGVACQTCHTTSLGTAFKLWRAEGTPRAAQRLGDTVVTHGAVPDSTCASCHTGDDATSQQVSASAGHRAHFDAAEPVPCQRCHAGSVHAGRPAAATCADTGCHDTQTMARSPMAEQHCLTCHQFLSPAQAQAGSNSNWTQCTDCHGPDSARALPVSLHAKMPCDTCHRPHEEPFTVARGCEDCHDQVVHAHPEVEDTVYCTACHGPHDEWSVAPQRCAGCHEDQVLEALPEALVDIAAMDDSILLVAQAEQAAHATCVDCHKSHERGGEMGSKRCTDCHDDVEHPARHMTSSCDDCHAPHRPKPQSCDGCHADDVRVRHGSAECEDCHSVHTNPFEKKACTSCHQDAPRGRSGHPESQCGDCHQPHQPQPKDCKSCHADEVKAVRGMKPEHANCDGCHKAHDWTFDKAECKTCHEVQAKATSAIKDHSACETCHATHTQATKAPAQCADCHKADLRRTVADHRDCAQCHDVHSGSKAGKKDCADCHEEQFKPSRGTPKHDACKDCHAVHPSPGFATPTCASCHDGGKAKQPVGLHTDKGHAECADCHTAHGPVDASRAACLKCHEDYTKHEPEAPLCNGCHVFRAP